MPAYLDDQPLRSAGESLRTALASARQQLENSGRMIVEVHLDGEVLTGDEVASQQSSPLGSKELRLYSADPRELVVLTLRQARSLLEEAKQAQDEAADLFQKDQPQSALHQVRRALDAWAQTQRAVSQCLELQAVSLDDKFIDGRLASEIVTQLVDPLKALKDYLENRDTVALADALAYEWPQNNEQWTQLINHMIDWAEES